MEECVMIKDMKENNCKESAYCADNKIVAWGGK